MPPVALLPMAPQVAGVPSFCKARARRRSGIDLAPGRHGGASRGSCIEYSSTVCRSRTLLPYLTLLIDHRGAFAHKLHGTLGALNLHPPPPALASANGSWSDSALPSELDMIIPHSRDAGCELCGLSVSITRFHTYMEALWA